MIYRFEFERFKKHCGKQCPCKIKEAILEGKIGNKFEEAFKLMQEIGKIKGITRDK